MRHPTFYVFHTCRINNLLSALSGFEGWNRQKSGVSTVYQRKLSNVDRCLCVQRLGITTHERTACQIACTGMGSLKIVTIVIDKNGVAMVELEEFQGKGIRDRTAWTRWVDVESRGIVLSKHAAAPLIFS